MIVGETMDQETKTGIGIDLQDQEIPPYISTGKTKWVSLIKLKNGFHIAVKSGDTTPCDIKLINENDDDY